jgi:pimeloyl-ACP methyl ester carboxylesterase
MPDSVRPAHERVGVVLAVSELWPDRRVDQHGEMQASARGARMRDPAGESSADVLASTAVGGSFELQHLTLHGHRVAYRRAGSGPVIVLLHGITSSSATWGRVMPYLADRFTVVAPDFLGHGESAKPRGDYSLGAHASGIRDLLVALGHERATFVGHSLGGGVAMQLAYQFPERCERLVLVDSGGLGREISPLLRAASLPGAELLLPLLADRRLIGGGRGVGNLLSRVGLRLTTDLDEIARGHASLTDPGTRSAFVHTLRTLVEPGGQRIDASDRLYLAGHVPFLLIWGARDRIIPVEHGHRANARVPGSRLEIFPEAGHFPQVDNPERFLDVLRDFLDSTPAGNVDREEWQQMMQRGAQRPGPIRRDGTGADGPPSEG